VVGFAVERMDGVVVEVAPVLEAMGLAAGLTAGAAVIIGAGLADAGCEVVAVGVTEGVVRGGATVVEAILTVGSTLMFAVSGTRGAAIGA
jgi:hypothetical protein